MAQAPDNHLMVAEVNGQGSVFEVGEVRRLFEAPFRRITNFYFDVSPDGRRFLVNALVDQSPLNVVVNWPSGLGN